MQIEGENAYQILVNLEKACERLQKMDPYIMHSLAFMAASGKDMETVSVPIHAILRSDSQLNLQEYATICSEIGPTAISVTVDQLLRLLEQEEVLYLEGSSN